MITYQYTVNSAYDDCITVPKFLIFTMDIVELLLYTTLLQWQTLPLSPEIRSLQRLIVVMKRVPTKKILCTSNAHKQLLTYLPAKERPAMLKLSSTFAGANVMVCQRSSNVLKAVTHAIYLQRRGLRC